MKSTVKVAKTVDEAVELAIKELNCSKEEAVIEVIEEPKSGIFGLFGSKDAMVRVSCEEDISKLLDEVILDNSSKVENNIKKDTKPERASRKEKEEPVEVSKTEKPVEKPKVETTEEVKDEEIEPVEIDEEFKVKIKSFLNSVIQKMGIESNIETFTDDFGIKFNIIPVNENDIGIVIGKRGETLDAIQYIANLVANRNTDRYIRISVDCNGYRDKRINSLKSLARKMANKAIKYNKNMRLEPMNPFERRVIHSSLQSFDGIYTVSEGNEPFRRVVIKIKRD
ncbi:RNA-binding cell elongation regulator Jag/EloR [Mediannikoviicoccus vaginalis]|uniref:RNA-binding cell elongation regulator Jag/EloR n=1 Tax=Mediannikoviicoccus vaginalis TaxID=2899727 RepID=UPI001F4827BA|nr:RNA-binding cell elongation regulator Jag/EloR [Mediannikoviicoccus vaginalis]